MEGDSLTPWERKTSRLHSDCRVYRIIKERWTNSLQASQGEFYIMDVPDWAVALALTNQGSIVLVRQFRFGSGDFSWELPAGVIDRGESILEGATRELYEESGYRGKSTQLLGSVHPNPAIQRNKCHFVLVHSAERMDVGKPDPHESFEVREIALAEIFKWARNGTITHSIVHTALFFLRDHLLEEGYSPSDLGER